MNGISDAIMFSFGMAAYLDTKCGFISFSFRLHLATEAASFLKRDELPHYQLTREIMPEIKCEASGKIGGNDWCRAAVC